MNQINNNNMSNKIIESREIIVCLDDDRYVLLVKENGKVIGLNFMQGCDSDSLKYFKALYLSIDHELTDFYNATEQYLTGGSQINRINQAIWAFFEFKNLRDARKAL